MCIERLTVTGISVSSSFKQLAACDARLETLETHRALATRIATSRTRLGMTRAGVWTCRTMSVVSIQGDPERVPSTWLSTEIVKSTRQASQHGYPRGKEKVRYPRPHRAREPSRRVKDLSAGAGIAFTGQGVHKLQGLSEPWRLLAAAT